MSADKLATVTVSRDDRSLYTVVVEFADGTNACSTDWRTINSAMEFASRLIGNELHRRLVQSDPRAVVP